MSEALAGGYQASISNAARTMHSVKVCGGLIANVPLASVKSAREFEGIMYSERCVFPEEPGCGRSKRKHTDNVDADTSVLGTFEISRT